MVGPLAGQCESLHEVVTLPLEAAVIIAAQCALLALVLVLREPRLLIPAVIVGLPIEVLESQALDYLGRGGISGAVRSLLNPGQLAMVATVVIGVVRVRHNPSRLIPNSSLIIPLGALIAVLFLGVFWSDSLIPDPSVITLFLYLAFIFVAPTLIESREDLERIAIAFLLIAIPLSLLAIAQRFGIFNWRSVLTEADAYTYRSNATFADPNNLARFLANTIALSVGLILATGPRRTTLYLAVPVLGLGALAILLTASRSGWLLLPMVCFLIVLVAPIARYTKGRLVLAGFVLVTLAAGFVLVQGGEDAARIRSFGTGVAALGQREFLIRAGWAMFTDNPLTGVGTGSYPNAIVLVYQDFVPEWARKTTLSHTSFITVAAELGLIGLATLAFVALRTISTIARLYRSLAANYERLFVGWIGVALFGIFLGSQSEGRLFEEPFLWVLFAILIAIESGPAFKRKVPSPRTPRTRPATTATTLAAPLAPAPLPTLPAATTPAEPAEGTS